MAQRLYELDRSSPRFPEQLNELLHDEEWVHRLRLLLRGELVELIDYLDDILDNLDYMDSQFREGLYILQEICGLRAIFPRTCEVSGKLSLSIMEPVEHGAFSTIYMGSIGEVDVLIKRPWYPTGDEGELEQELCREIVMWKHLSHPNIVPFKGATFKPPRLVSEWMPSGKLSEYIKNNNQADLISLLLDVAEGLSYLHSCNVVHGSLTGGHILVDTSGNARITDFGCARIVRNVDPPGSTLGNRRYVSRWTAPEILKLDSLATKASDIFSLGMVITEAFTGEVPFSEETLLAEVVEMIKNGVRPKLPNHTSFTGSLWNLTLGCWSQRPQDRPDIWEVIEVLEKLRADWIAKTLSTRNLHSGGTEWSGSSSGFSPSPTLPQAPTKGSSQEEFVNEVLDLTDQVASTSLFGPIGIGKSFVAHNLLQHNRTETKFGTNRHFVRCDDLMSSLEDFLERLADVINADRTTNAAQLRSHLESSPPLILLLDGVDLILDPLADEAEEISATIEELGSYPHVCLVTTSRMNPEIPGFHRLEVPIPSEDDARDVFYNLCNLGRSSAVDGLIMRLDFHPLSIDLLARAVRENEWDESTLLKALDDGRASALEESYHVALKGAMELSFRCPTIQNLGTTAQSALEAIAAFPQGIQEHMLENSFPGITGTGAAVDVLCKFSFVYRQDGFVKMLSPFRFYFLESAVVHVQHAEVIRWGTDCNPAQAPPPVFTCGPKLRSTAPPSKVPYQTPPYPAVPRRKAFPREEWIRIFESVKRRLRALFGHPRGPTINVISVEEDPPDIPPATSTQNSCMLVGYEIEEWQAP